MLKVRYPHLITIIVPRHPDRAPAIEAMLVEKGLKVARRSANEPIEADTDILLGDTIGEMGLYLQLTEIAFIGNSLTKEGGHNPLEPAMMGTAVLTGRNVQNFRESFQRLIKNGGARIVKDRNMLAGDQFPVQQSSASACHDQCRSEHGQGYARCTGSYTCCTRAVYPAFDPAGTVTWQSQ